MIVARAGSSTDTGRVRAVNQDALLADNGRFVVADGMGGHEGGEIASQLTIAALAEAQAPKSLDDVAVMVGDANGRVLDYAAEHPEVRGMGTTVCLLVALADGDRMAIANVGDSRLYRRDADGLHRMTRDHSLVESLVRDGRLSPEEAAVHPQRNILTQAVGIDRRLQLDAWEIAPRTGDRFVICSDGLHGELADPEISQILDGHSSAQDAAEALVAAACEAGGRDNVTVVVVDVAEGDDSADSVTDRVVEARLGVVSESAVPATPAPDRSALVAANPASSEASPDGPASPPQVVTWRVVAFAGAVVVVLAGLLATVIMVGRSGYSVVVDQDGSVMIQQGPEDGFLWFEPTVEERSPLVIDELLPADQQNVRDGQEFGSLAEARLYLEYLGSRTVAGNDS